MHNVTSRSEWMVYRRQILCYESYEIDSHMSPKCMAKLNIMELVVHDYEKLTDEQATLVPADSYNLAKQYLKMKRDLTTSKRNSGKKPQNESKTS